MRPCWSQTGIANYCFTISFDSLLEWLRELEEVEPIQPEAYESPCILRLETPDFIPMKISLRSLLRVLRGFNAFLRGIGTKVQVEIDATS